MRSIVHQLVLGLLMSAGTVAVCSVPTDGRNATKGANASAEPAMCKIPAPPVDVTAPLTASLEPDPPALHRLRATADAPGPRRDYFDEDYDDDRYDPPPRRSRSSRRPAPRAIDPAGLLSGLEDRPGQTLDRRVMRFVTYFTESREGRAAFSAALRRSGRYEEIIVRSLRERRLPPTLIAAALVESGFSPTAVSPMGAGGLWQFMPETARAYGLRVERGLDERRNVWRASDAAADHLADLHDQLKSWELALAAYNLGYNGLTHRLDQYKTNSFWELADIEGALPAETAQYVPRVVAAAIVLANLDAFDLDSIARDEPIEAGEVEVPPGTSLVDLSEAAALPVRLLRDLNLELDGDVVPTTSAPVLLHAPVRAVNRIRDALARLDDRDRDRDRGHDRDSERRTARFDRFERDDGEPSRRRSDAWSGSRRPPYAVGSGEDIGGRTARYDDDPRDRRRDSRARDRYDDEPQPRYRDRDDRPRGYRDDGYDDPPPERRAPRRESYEDRRASNEDRSARRPSSRSVVFYRTVDGDSISSIARTFGLPADEVRMQNGIKADDTLERGALLRLRVPAAVAQRVGATSG